VTQRHSGFDTVREFQRKLPCQNYDGWVLFGHFGATFSWENNGLRHTAEWSHTSGLHVYTNDMHNNCLRIICPLVEAQSIIERIRVWQQNHVETEIGV